MDELIAPSPESLSHFISTSLSRGVLQLRMLHSPPVTLHKFPFPSVLLNLTNGAASHTHVILFPWGSAILWKLWTDSAVEWYNSTICFSVFNKRNATYYQVRQSDSHRKRRGFYTSKKIFFLCLYIIRPLFHAHCLIIENPQSSSQDHDFQTAQRGWWNSHHCCSYTSHSSMWFSSVTVLKIFMLCIAFISEGMQDLLSYFLFLSHYWNSYFITLFSVMSFFIEI